MLFRFHSSIFISKKPALKYPEANCGVVNTEARFCHHSTSLSATTAAISLVEN